MQQGRGVPAAIRNLRCRAHAKNVVLVDEVEAVGDELGMTAGCLKRFLSYCHYT